MNDLIGLRLTHNRSNLYVANNLSSLVIPALGMALQSSEHQSGCTFIGAQQVSGGTTKGYLYVFSTGAVSTNRVGRLESGIKAKESSIVLVEANGIVEGGSDPKQFVHIQASGLSRLALDRPGGQQ